MAGRIKLKKRKPKKLNTPRKKRVEKNQASPLQIIETGPAKLASPEEVLYDPSLVPKQREFVSNRCSSFTKNGTRCKLNTLKGTKCWIHLMKEENLRVKHYNLFPSNTKGNKNFGLFSGKKPFKIKKLFLTLVKKVQFLLKVILYFN